LRSNASLRNDLRLVSCLVAKQTHRPTARKAPRIGLRSAGSRSLSSARQFGLRGGCGRHRGPKRHGSARERGEPSSNCDHGSPAKRRRAEVTGRVVYRRRDGEMAF